MNNLRLISQKWVVNERMMVIRALTSKGRLLLHDGKATEAIAIFAMIDVLSNPQKDKHHLEAKRQEIETMLKAE